MRSLVPLVLLLSLGAAACSDRATTSEPRLTAPDRPSTSGAPLVPLSLAIPTLIRADWPKGLETAAGTRWDGIAAKLAVSATFGSDGSITITDPNQYAVAQSMFRELSSWVQAKAPSMDINVSTDAKNAEAAKLVLLMSMYFAQGPQALAPSLGNDAVVVTIPANNVRTKVTSPARRAGVVFEANTFSEPTILSIANVTSDAARCLGPLPTTVCQYRLFYRFESFPHKRFNVAAHFAVCHVNGSDPLAPPPFIHDRLRLAHETPANPGDRTPGSRYIDGIEILPRVVIPSDLYMSLNCAGPTTALLDRIHVSNPLMARAWHSVAHAVTSLGEWLTPKDAYAIDAGGGGGDSFFLSDYANIDGAPDLEATSVTATPINSSGAASILPGSQVRLDWQVRNIGLASAVASGAIEFDKNNPDGDGIDAGADIFPGFTVRFLLAPAGTSDGTPPPARVLRELSLDPLARGASAGGSGENGEIVTIPSDITGNWKIQMVVDPTDQGPLNQVLDELNENNNTAEAPLPQIVTQGNPDLRISVMGTASPTMFCANEPNTTGFVTLSGWTVQNTGLAPSGTYSYRIFLSPLETVDVNANTLFGVGAEASLGVGASQSFGPLVNLVLPPNLSVGDWAIGPIVSTDTKTDAQPENNFSLAVIRVVPPGIALSVSVSSSKVSLFVGDTFQPSVTIRCREAPQTVTYSSSNAQVATVSDSNGLITGVSAGTATITVRSTADPTKFAQIDVTVSPPIGIN